MLAKICVHINLIWTGYCMVLVVSFHLSLISRTTQPLVVHYPRPRGRRVQYFVCLSVCLLTPNLCLNSFFLKSKQAASLRLGNLRQKVVLYKTGKFLQASVAQTAFKFENKKNLTYRSCTKDF